MSDCGPEETAEAAGREARAAGKARSANPYQHGAAVRYGLTEAQLTRLHRAWEAGWMATTDTKRGRRKARNYPGAERGKPDPRHLPEPEEPEPPRCEVHHVPPLRTQEPPALDKRQFWPEDAPFPGSYIRLYPCHGCRRVLTEDGGQAVYVRTSTAEIAYMRCRACSHRFQVPVR